MIIKKEQTINSTIRHNEGIILESRKNSQDIHNNDYIQLKRCSRIANQTIIHKIPTRM